MAAPIDPEFPTVEDIQNNAWDLWDSLSVEQKQQRSFVMAVLQSKRLPRSCWDFKFISDSFKNDRDVILAIFGRKELVCYNSVPSFVCAISDDLKGDR